MKRVVAVVVLVAWLTNCAPTLSTHKYHQYERGYAIIISERVGEKIDAEEREQFGLFKGVEDFESAIFYGIEDGGYEAEIRTTNSIFLAVNRDPYAFEILRDYIDGYETYMSSSEAFKKKWDVIDYDKLGFAITKSEVLQHSNLIASTACATGCAASIFGVSLLAALAIADPGDIWGTRTPEEERNAYIALGVGIVGGIVGGIFVHNWRNTINMEKALELIKEARKAHIMTETGGQG
ncbi:hypothetical protein KAR91_39715 [Candidatus Pacearchaeota archaeon]|nr:hypothetical protein [Candidatus Pacearchaeota archaeon]